MSVVKDFASDLINTKIILRSDLNEAEARNIAQAQVWLWAGEYRTTERNTGVAPYQIPIELMQLFDDVKFWTDNKTFSNQEIVVRLHHKIVQIHPFPNGNGRVLSVMADLLFQKLEGKTLYWCGTNLVDALEVQSQYIEALRKADAGDYTDLLNFTSR